MLRASRYRRPVFALRVARRPPLAHLLAALSERPGLAFVRGDGGAFVACDPDGDATSLDPFDGGRADASSAPALARAPRFIGAIPYEALRGIERPRWTAPEDRPTPRFIATRWLRYPAVARLGVDGALVSGPSRAAVHDLARRITSVDTRPPPARPTLTTHLADDDAAHEARIARARELIRAGDVYQVNLARRIDLSLAVRTEADFTSLFVALDSVTRARFGALLFDREHVVLSSSPELCLSATADARAERFDALVTEPIKGTRPRGRTSEGDRALAAELDASEKERAELAMIVDVERNDLHRVSRVGSVRLLGPPVVRTLPTVHHRFALVTGRARPDVSRADVLAAMLPSGSVTGAPKIRAMEIIRGLESHRRGLYTGAIAWAAHDGSVHLAMAIRTAVFDRSGEGEYLVGGGIVLDSVAVSEVAETRWKAAQLERVAALPAVDSGLSTM